jgi:dihydroxyacid dehydratase/phosphogluconate dehydratase
MSEPLRPLAIEEAYNPYRDCIQGLANEPITVLRLLQDAVDTVRSRGELGNIGDLTIDEVVRRLVANRPRVAIIGGSVDHPAHLYNRPHALMAALRIWQNGGVPFRFSVPVVCDATAQNNIGMSYSLASRNATAATVNITFEGHSYHAAYVLSGCDKMPSGVLSGLASADVARRARGNQAPVWAVFAPAHVLKGGVIPPTARGDLEALAARANAAGHDELGADIVENFRYILQCSSDEAFAGHLRRAENLGLIEPSDSRRLLNELAGATCDAAGGVCAFNGTGNSSRTLIAALGFTTPELELLTAPPGEDAVCSGVDALFGLLNRPEFAVGAVLRANFANTVRLLNATGSSTNMLLHLPAIMRYAGFDVTIADYAAVRDAVPVPEIFAHSLTEGRDTYVLARQFAEGRHRGMESLVRILADLGVPMDLDAPTVTGRTWRQRIDALTTPVDPSLGDAAVIRAKPIRERSGVEVLAGSFLDSCVVKVSGMSNEHIARFDDHLFIVRYYENEHLCNADLAASDLLDRLLATSGVGARLISRLVARNGGPPAGDLADPAEVNRLLDRGWLSFAFVIAGQGPKAYGMPEQFAPSQNLRHHRRLEASSIMLTDGRYSGVTKGPCLGHATPEAFDGGGIGYLKDGDVLRLRLTGRRIDLLDRDAFLNGTEQAVDPIADADRAPLFSVRMARMAHRQLDVAASNLLSDATDASRGVVPSAVDRRATQSWR